MSFKVTFALLLCFLVSASLLSVAQSPNTAAMTISVVDQTGNPVQGANISLVNDATGASRQASSGEDGSITVPALSLTGTYTVSVSKQGFGDEQRKDISLRAGETAVIRVKLMVGASKSEITIYGTKEGVSTSPEVGLHLDPRVINEAPILGRKTSTLPLLNSAFRQGKGTGDLFVNQTYFITGVGSRRTTTSTLDGANNDEAWGRQTAIATIPLGAIQEFTVYSNSFSPEFGWTSAPALNIVTKSGTNQYHGEGLFLARPGDMQAKGFSTTNFCPPSVSTCVTPTTLSRIGAIDIPDSLKQVSGSFGGPIIADRTFFFLTSDYTWQDRTAPLSPLLPTSLLPADGSRFYEGHYRQGLFNGRLDHKLTDKETLMVRFNIDRFHDDNPQDAVSGTNGVTTARNYARRAWTLQTNLTSVLSPAVLNEARFSYLHGDPVTLWSSPNISTAYTRGGSAPFSAGQSRFSNLYGYQVQFSDTLSWNVGRHNLRFGTSVVHHTSGGFGNEPGQVVLGTFTFKNSGAGSTQATLDQILANPATVCGANFACVQNYSQPLTFGTGNYELTQWLYAFYVNDHLRVRQDFTLDLGLRYDRQTLTDATHDFAPRIGFAWNPWGNSRTSLRGGYAMYYTQIQSNIVASYITGGWDGLGSYTATPGQTGFPTCLSGSCLPVTTTPTPATLPARDITVQAGRRQFYIDQFAQHGVDFTKLPYYPDSLNNPRSQVFTVGVERELAKGVVLSSDYVHQFLTGNVRTVDLNAPAPFDRTTVGQSRTVAAANATRPITPANGGVRQVNVLMNLGFAHYDGWQTQLNFRHYRKLMASVSYTLSKATNNSEPDGNGINPNQPSIARLGSEELGPSLVDQRHRAVILASYEFPLRFTLGTLMQFASARPFNATTGVDNDGDGSNNDRPVVNGQVLRKSAFRGTATSDVGLFLENRLKLTERTALLLRIEGFNLFNHGNFLGRGQTVYGNGATPNADFGAFVSGVGTSASAIPAFANIDPPRMFQLQARFTF